LRSRRIETQLAETQQVEGSRPSSTKKTVSVRRRRMLNLSFGIICPGNGVAQKCGEEGAFS
ncbi:hypothetical protein AVEN_128263-1, partial [Araneus ventricosus]